MLIQDRVLFAISTNKNLFEICDLYKPMGDYKLISKFYDEIASVRDMISYFKFDEKTGL